METSNDAVFLPLSSYSLLRNSKSISRVSSNESRGESKPLEGANHHRHCSASFLIEEEQPSWLDDLLDDSEIVFHKGHRRSASDSFTYLGEAGETLAAEDESEFVNAYFGGSARSQNLVRYKDVDGTSNETEGLAQKNNKETGEEGTSLAVENSSKQNQEGSADKAAGSQIKNSGSKNDSKRSKQNNAHRSRVRKLQYIAHLERTLGMLKVTVFSAPRKSRKGETKRYEKFLALRLTSIHVPRKQAEGTEVSAGLEFIQQQNVILTMENRALRQRLESISQEQIIKNWEQGMLEREIGRLQSLYHLQKQQQMQMHRHQQQQQQPHNQQSKQRRNRNREFDHQENNATMRNKDGICSKALANGYIQV